MDLAVAMSVQAALVGHYRDGEKVTIHLVGTGAEADRRFLLKRYPGFERCARLSVHPVPDDDDFAETTGELIDTLDGEAFATVLLAERGEHEALIEALLLGERCGGSDRFRVLMSAPSESPVRHIVAEPDPTGENPLSRWIQFVPTIREACGRDAVFSETLDELARRIHRAWYEGTSARISDAELAGRIAEAETHRSKPSYRSWENLAEKQRDAIRYAADHLKIKIRAAGLDPDDMAGLQESWQNLSPETLDRLARMEHERWSAPLWMSGWIFGEARDESKRVHNNLRPYDELDEDTRNYDIEQVQAVAGYLTQAS